MIDKAEIERLANAVGALSVQSGNAGKRELIRDDLLRLAARCDNNPTEEKEVMQFDPAERAAIVHQPVAQPPVSEAGGDQPAGEPVPLPKPGVADADGKPFAYWPDQLREYAETVAAPLRERVAELEQSRTHLGRLADETLERALTAERERDAISETCAAVIADTAKNLGCKPDNEEILLAISGLKRSLQSALCDASRYRWLRECNLDIHTGVLPAFELGDRHLDAAIDSAMGDSIEGKS